MGILTMVAQFQDEKCANQFFFKTFVGVRRKHLFVRCFFDKGHQL